MLHFGTHGSLEFMPGKQVRCKTPRPSHIEAPVILTSVCVSSDADRL